MSDGEILYSIKHNKKLNDIWESFSHDERRRVLAEMRDRTEKDLERTMLEIRTGQNRLF